MVHPKVAVQLVLAKNGEQLTHRGEMGDGVLGCGGLVFGVR